MESNTPTLFPELDARMNNMLPRMNLSYSSDIMNSNLSWCRIRSTDEEPLSYQQHKHTVHELHYVYEGRLCFDFSSTYKALECRAGEYIFIPSGIVHSSEAGPEYTKKLVLGFDISSGNEIINETFNEALAPMALKETKVFHDLAQALMHKSSTSNLITSVSIGCIVQAILLEIVDSIVSNTKNGVQRLKETEDSLRINQILSYINTNVFNDITIADIANQLGLSVRQTARICSRLFGCTLNRLIVNIRIKEICSLLANSQYSISDIAEMAGFSTPYSFSRHFSHYTGVTPTAYRRNYEIQHLQPKVTKDNSSQ